MRNFILSLALPIVVLLGWAIMLNYQVTTGQEVRIRIKGYDPRDLLSGHYIRYRLDFGSFDSCPGSSNQATCLCLRNDTDGIHHVPITSQSCKINMPDCQFKLRGECSSGQFLAGVERYSIPDNLAPVLATLPENSSVILSIDGAGNGRVKQVLVENETLEEFAIKSLAEKMH